ncbi:MAG: hypothetical protein LUE17_15540 [Planctomycetaceae bacterium]|nr:hypothetical protein [Planctomycetaceae bacterium]
MALKLGAGGAVGECGQASRHTVMVGKLHRPRCIGLGFSVLAGTPAFENAHFFPLACSNRRNGAATKSASVIPSSAASRFHSWYSSSARRIEIL